MGKPSLTRLSTIATASCPNSSVNLLSLKSSYLLFTYVASVAFEISSNN
ncbi:hypothetical protein [Empedobacter sp.]|nr:hypothetical protein [Empedobacter sp.]